MFKRSRLPFLLLLLIMATSAKARPTLSNFNDRFLTGVVSPTSENHVLFVLETSQITEPSSAHLANIGIELLRPPPDFTSSPPVGTKSLPPIPAALFMVLTGFLCVSLVKDRSFWLGALAGLFWAGQTGFQTIPKLAAHISSKKHIQRKSHTNTVRLHQFKESFRLRSDIEGTKYIGLLHHLAGIPNATTSLILPSFLQSLRAQRAFSPERSRRGSNLIAPLKQVSFAQTKCRPAAPQFAITYLSSLPIRATNCLAPEARQYILFSPAFTFVHLARGPPKPT